jgi:hypothetical protein
MAEVEHNFVSEVTVQNSKFSLNYFTDYVRILDVWIVDSEGFTITVCF